MADEPISALTLFTSYSTADEVEILDVSDTTFAATGTNKRIQFSTLLSMAGVGSGGLTSVGLSVPSWLTVSNSPLTANGTLNVTATTGETANQFLATPSGTTGGVGLRAITTTDLPSAVVLNTGTYASPAWLTAISGGIVSGNIAGSATSDVTLAPGSSTRNVIQPTADFKPLILKGSSGQSSNLQEWQNSSGTVLASMDASGNFQDSPYTASKAFTITFANGVANQKADLYMTGTQVLWGYLDVAVSSNFEYSNASGALVRRYYLGFNSGGGTYIYTNVVKTLDDGGPLSASYALSPLTWDATNNRYRIQVISSTTSQNSVYIYLRFVSGVAGMLANFQTFIFGTIYKSDTKVWPQQHADWIIDNPGFATRNVIQPTVDCVPLAVQASTSQTNHLQEWQSNAGTPLSFIRSDGSIGLVSLADSAAANNSLYYSTTSSKLCYKDSSGSLHTLT